MRWLLLLVTLAGFALAFTTKSPGLLGVGLLAGFGGLISFAFALAAARIAETSQPDSAMIVDPEVNALRDKTQRTRIASETQRVFDRVRSNQTE
jgi:hypothetical protein